MKASSRIVTLSIACLAVALAAPALYWLLHPVVPAPEPGPAPRNATPQGLVIPPVARKLEHPIALIGVDGADWQIIDPLIEGGRLPNLARLKARSTWGHLRSSEPILSPLLWTTAVTGKPPDEHGIIDFLVQDTATGHRVPITSASRKTRALWNIFSDAGLSSDFIAWWASWPAERIAGRIVSDRVAYSLFQVDKAGGRLTYPESLWQELRPEMRSDRDVSYEEVARFLDVGREEFAAARERAAQDPERAYKEPINHLARILSSTQSYHRIALRLLRDGQPDLFGVYYQGIDEVCHRFAHYMPPRMAMVGQEDFQRYRRAVDEYYVYQDELLGELLAALTPATTVIVMSDHGFQNGGGRPTDGPADIEGKPGKWHRLYGVIMMAGEGIAPARLDTATLLDISPTVLSLAGLPLARDMKGRPLLPPHSAQQSVASYENPAGPGQGPGPPGQGAGAAALSQADAELLRNLASLGYIGSTGSAAAIGAAAPGAAQAPAEATVTTPSSAGATAPTITAHTNMATLLAQKGDLPGAEVELRKALELRPSYFPALMSLSQVLVRQGRVLDALYATRRAVATTPDAEPGAYVQLALLAAREGQSAEAASFLSALSTRRPTAAGIPVARGVLRQSAGDKRGAEEMFRAALAIDPASIEAMGRLFQLYAESGRQAALEPLVRRGVAANERSVMHHNWLGLIRARQGDAPAAEKEFQRALELAPDFGGTMANLGSLYGRGGRLDEAVAVLTRAVRIEPGNLEARMNLGAALAKLGRLDEAIESLQETRRLGLRSPDLLNALGLAYAQKGMTREAIDTLRESLTLSPDQPAVVSLLSELKTPA